MSKLDAQRAMREARYAATQARAGKTTDKTTGKVSDKLTGKAERPAPKPARSTPDAADAVDGLCGHRAISGKTCTRERGHTAKSHRYS